VDRTFTDLPEAAPDAMVCVDSQGRIAAVNAQARPGTRIGHHI
jgi:hypothetical protein